MFVVEKYAQYTVSINPMSQDLFKDGVKFASNVDFTKSRTNDTVRFERLLS